MNIWGQKVIQKTIKQPINRICNGFMQMGHVKRTADTRTTEEIVQTIEHYAEKSPEIKKFVAEIKTLDKKHMGIISDVLEVSSHTDMLPTNMDMSKIAPRGVSYREAIVEDLIAASKQNPEAMELVNAIVNNTDSTTIKYIMSAMTGGVLKIKDLAKHMQETAKAVPALAESTLKGGYTMDFVKEENFLNLLKTCLNEKVQPDKIKLLFNDVLGAVNKVTEKSPESIQTKFVLDRFLHSKVPMEQIQENIKVLPTVLENLLGKVKEFDVVDFLTKNVNIK